MTVLVVIAGHQDTFPLYMPLFYVGKEHNATAPSVCGHAVLSMRLFRKWNFVAGSHGHNWPITKPYIPACPLRTRMILETIKSFIYSSC